MKNKSALPPGPGTLGFLGLLLGGHDYMRRMQRKHGDIMHFGTIPELGPTFIVTHPDQVRELFVADPAELDSTEGQRPAEIVYGPSSLFLINGTEHRRLRRMMVPSFKGAALERFSDTVAEVMRQRITLWPRLGTISVLNEAYDIALEVILRIVMGLNTEAQLARWRQPMHSLLEATLSNETAVRFALRRIGGISSWRSFNKTHRTCDELVFAEIARRRRDTNRAPDEDMLGMLIAARDEDGLGMGDEVIRDQLMTLLIAGHETTATTFSWALERMVRHPLVMSRVVAEAEESERAYTEAMIKETLRLRPPVIFIPRRTLAPFRLGHYLIPAGSTIAAYPPLVHRSAALYENPEDFQPERFLNGSMSTFGWLPFGGGLHACLGNHFAIMQVRVMLHTLLRYRNVAYVNPADEKPQFKAVVQVPAHGCLIRFSPRQQMAPAPKKTATTGCPFHGAQSANETPLNHETQSAS